MMCFIALQPGFADGTAPWAQKAFAEIRPSKRKMGELGASHNQMLEMKVEELSEVVASIVAAGGPIVASTGPDKAFDGITLVSSPSRRTLCYKVSKKPTTSDDHIEKLSKLKSKFCEGSGNGHHGTGQVGSVCCPSLDGHAVCCIGLVAGEGGGSKVAAKCSGDKNSRLWLRGARPVQILHTRKISIGMCASTTLSIMLVGLAVLRWKSSRNSANVHAVTRVPLGEEEVEDQEQAVE
jgi:hypothetical protein